MRVNPVPDDTPDEPPSRRGRGRRKDPLGPESEIGARLRALYSEVEKEPVPTELLDLLEQLGEAERRAGK